MARLTIRIDLGESRAFGPGKARLLELIDETGSLRRAAAAMTMSYRRAWLLLSETEALTTADVVATRTGGPKGGGTVLTPFGRRVVKHYRAIEALAGEATATELAALRRMTRPSSSSPSAKTPRKKVTRKKPRPSNASR